MIFRPKEPNASDMRNPARRMQLNRHLPAELRRPPPTAYAPQSSPVPQTVRPSVRPPRPDSQLKGLIRTLISVEKFHELQESQRSKTMPWALTVSRDLGDGPTKDVGLLIINFINEVHTKIEAATFFYERFLDFIEFSLDTEDEPGVCPGEIVACELREQEREQVRIAIENADRILFQQMSGIIGK
jgi:hypothetical protein